MRDLKTFQEKIEAYRKNAPTPHTQKDLAQAIPLDKDELSKRLNAYKHPQKAISPLSCAQVQAIVRTLASWGAIQTQEQAKDLLDLMECPHFSASDWKTSPLHLLRSAPPSPMPIQSKSMSPDRQSSEKRFARLRAIQVHENGFQRYRLDNFVGRQVELAHIRQHIEALLPTGGYLAITGLAGQGKSSIIAKLVDEHHGANAIHHFIPPNPGLGYQVSLLRDLLAQLIVKHGELPEFYVASENRAVLRNYFANALTEIGALKRQEVIFIDGLDQLVEDYNGERDLSFLPSKLPKGIVLVIGTRPDDAQKPLQMREPSIEYQLPNLKREDFDLLLDKRRVTISTALADQIYQVMQQNALFLSLAAHELAVDKKARPEEIIRRVADNPEN